MLCSILVKCSPKDLPVEHTESGESANKPLVRMVEDIPDLPPPTLAGKIIASRLKRNYSYVDFLSIVKTSVETIPVQAAPSGVFSTATVVKHSHCLYIFRSSENERGS